MAPSFILSLSLSLSLSTPLAAPAGVEFRAAQPIWPTGRELERNLTVGFRAEFDAPARGSTALRVTGHTLYRAFLDGEFIGHGPARAGHGHYRVDEWDLTDRLRPGRHVVALEVVGYNVNSYDTLDLPSFVQAEVVASNGVVLAATSAGEPKAAAAPFRARILRERVQKTRRYSFQRPFSEVWRLAPGWDSWRAGKQPGDSPVSCSRAPAKKLLPRRVPYPRFAKRPAVWQVARGAVRVDPTRPASWRDRALTNIGPKLGGYVEADLESVPTKELQRMVTTRREAVDRPLAPDATIALAAGEHAIVDLGTNLTGFVGAEVRCKEATRLFVAFDEVLTEGDVDFKRLACANVVLWELRPGHYRIEAFEPYTMRYAKLIALEGACEVSGVYLREYANPDVWEAWFACSDPRLLQLFAAGRETFAQNAVDVFMDCPSRERAGWLCDSFFTARTALDVSGDTRVEKCFIENFLLPERFEHLPDGMLPMCYPADHDDGVFIPNWALWFVVQLEEYAARSGDRALVEALEPRVLALLDYFRPFENEDGLLEKLESWVFIEWSAANRFVQDVNYPSNMLYAHALDVAGRLWGREDLTRRAQKLRRTIHDQSWNGEFFRDHAVREGGTDRSGGRLVVKPDTTEVCQYYAFFFGIASPERHAELWERLRGDFGPDRKETGKWPGVHMANSFIGNMLRFEILSRHGCAQQILDESIGYLLYMAERTGTLWENTQAHASCNHGFASHIVHTLYRDVLGVRRVDSVHRRVDVRLSNLRLDWCEGRIPCADGFVALRWWREGDRVLYRLDVPAGYSARVEDRTGGTAERRP